MNIFQDVIDGVKISLDVYLDTKNDGFNVQQITTFKDHIRKKGIFVSKENIGQFFKRMSESGLEDIVDAMKSVIAKKFTIINILVENFNSSKYLNYYVIQDGDEEYEEVKRILQSHQDKEKDNTVMITPLPNGEECCVIISRNKPKSTRVTIVNKIFILEEQTVASLLSGRAIGIPLKSEKELNELLFKLHSLRGTNERLDTVADIIDNLKNSISFENDFVPDLSQYDLI